MKVREDASFFPLQTHLRRFALSSVPRQQKKEKKKKRSFNTPVKLIPGNNQILSLLPILYTNSPLLPAACARLPFSQGDEVGEEMPPALLRPPGAQAAARSLTKTVHITSKFFAF